MGVDWKGELFVVPVANEVLFPGGILSTVLSPEEAFDIEDLVDSGPVLFVARQPLLVRRKKHRGLYLTGTIAELTSTESPDGTVYLDARGLARATVESYRGREPSLFARVVTRSETTVMSSEEARVLHELRAMVRRLTRIDPRLELDVMRELMPLGDPWQLIDLIAGIFVTSVEDRQRLLEASDRLVRLELLRGQLQRLELSLARPGVGAPETYLN